METSEILKKIRKIEITTKKLVNEVFSGEYHSMFKGHGLEFAEVREYQSGDSFKEIDWNVTARYGHPYIKKFNETRELNVIFLVDGSSSTVFGTQNMLKNELITEITALLSFSALSNNDKVGLLLFADDIEQYSPPRKGKKYALKILRDILYYRSQNKSTNLENALKYLWSICKKKSIIFIISDFITENYEHSLEVLSKKHDVIAIKVNDPAELKLPNAGIIHLQCPETGQILVVNTMKKSIREKYDNLIADREAKITERFKKMNVDLLNIYTNKPYVYDLIKFFKLRVQRKKR
ncbi:MAG: DUF58 domain-containing protein [Candidatus Cloacimonetes bacterium]|jgi:uncharacterized protein (DUF58 family)|nr:DUF58 domain-containing protein [Candidatus Cloacimonadota bacterium]